MDTNRTPEPDDQTTRPLPEATQPLPEATQPLPEPRAYQPAQSQGTAAEAATAGTWLRRHALGAGIAAAALAVVVVAGGTAWGVSAAVASTQTMASAPLKAAGRAASAPKAGGNAKAKHKVHGATGTITAISGGTWTLHAASGATVTVKLDSSTALGTKKAPATASSFAVGDRVGALGTRTGDTVTATRIVHLPLKPHTPTASPAPTPAT